MRDPALDMRIWDVEHGSAMYIDAVKKHVVIDCGSNNNFSPLRWIRSPKFGVNNLHYLIISHPHEDHIDDIYNTKKYGLKPNIINRPKKARPIVEQKLEEEKKKDNEEYVKNAKRYLELDEYSGTPNIYPSDPRWSLGVNPDNNQYSTDGSGRGVSFHHYSTKKLIGNDRFEKLNNLSKVTVIKRGEFKIVTTGDLLEDGIKHLMKNNDGMMDKIKNSDVLVAPHHGRKPSFVKDFVDHINPDLVVFSDKGDVNNTATDEYGKIANGKNVFHEDNDNTKKRNVVTTRNDGRIRIQAVNRNNWEVSVYGKDYAEEQSNSSQYNDALRYKV